MTVESITLKDFQVHENLKLVLSPGITTIRGATDTGKSSILRAVRWICLNALPGDQFIREGAKETEITLNLRPGNIHASGTQVLPIKRKKGQRENSYALGDKLFYAFGQGVPSEIATLLNLNEINFQGQHDAPFWFSETAGEVSRQLNAVIDLSVIDTALSNIANAARTAKERRDLCQERLEKVKEQFDQIEIQRLRVKQFKDLQVLDEKCEKIHARIAPLETMLEEIAKTKAKSLRSKADEMEEVFVLAKKVASTQRRLRDLHSLLYDINETQQQIKSGPPDFTQVEAAYTRWEKADTKKLELGNLLSFIRLATDNAKTWREKSVRLEKKFHEEMKGKLCPLCGNKL